METVYLDSAATTKPVDSIAEAVKPYIESKWYNPSAKYSKGSDIKKKIESVRANIAKEIGADSNEIYFTSGATESNNWVIRGFVDQCKIEDKKPLIITTNIEHSSIIQCVKAMEKLYAKCIYLPVNQNGCFILESLNAVLKFYKDIPCVKVLVTIGMGNNEIGTIQDITSIANMVHNYDGVLHTDATQCFGHIPINNQILCADMISASAQKFGGLKGIGFLYKKNSIEIQPLIYGSQEQGQRGGTENVVGIVALGEAINQIDYSKTDKVKHLRNYMIEKLVKRLGCKVNGTITDRLPNNINITFPQSITGEALIYILETDDIYISAGSACNSHSNQPSHVLKAIGLSDEEASKTIRSTLSDDITAGQIEFFVNQLEKAIKLLTL